MTQERTTRRGWVVTYQDVVRLLAVLAVTIIVLAALALVFGLPVAGPSRRDARRQPATPAAL